MKISVFGLGYVGTVSAACLAQQGHLVIGVDVNPDKVQIINEGRSPVIERDIDEVIAQTVSSGTLRATTDAGEAVLETDVSLICVGTPSKENGSLDLTYVERVCGDIGGALRQKNDFQVVVLRSTVLPGTTEECAIPILEQASGRNIGPDGNLGICFNPEFLREGTSVHDFYHPPYTVIGHLDFDQRAVEVVSSLYSDLESPLLIVPINVAEMVKYANNAFHALKVVFANEIGNICKRQGIDSHRVMDIFCMDEKLNLSPYYLKPGFAFGGSCLPKDLRALLYQGRSLDIKSPVLEAILHSNRRQVTMGFDIVRRTGKKKVGVLGFSFKAGTDDLRESPLVELIEILLGKGYQVQVYDRNVSLARLHGKNKAYIERQIPHIASLMNDSLTDLLDESEVIVIGNQDPEFASILENQVRSDHVIVDLVRIWQDPQQLDAQYQGICW